MIVMTKAQIDAVFAHGGEGYPHEVCGIMIGRFDGGAREVVHVRRGGNLNSERAHDRYELDPRDLLAAEKSARGEGLEVIGIYHTHPDHPDAPSEFDRQRAWPGYSYLIASVRGGDEFTARSWLLNEETESFEEETITIRGEERR